MAILAGTDLLRFGGPATAFESFGQLQRVGFVSLAMAWVLMSSCSSSAKS
jgi:hypothetical protein